jgi:hypothetical protein
MPKKLAVEKKWQKPKENSLPKITSTKHPQHRLTHPKPPPKKKQTKNKTHSANLLLFFFRIPPQIQTPERRKNNQRQAKDTQKLSKSFNWVPWICKDSGTEMV